MPPKKKKRGVTLYNLIFPIFLLLWPPVALMIPVFGGLVGCFMLLAMLAGNLLIDWLVTALALRWQKIPNVKQKSLSVLVKVWLSGFAADFVGGLPLVIIMFIKNEWVFQHIENYFYNSIYRSPLALAVTLCAVLLAGLCIYRFNLGWSLEDLDLTEQQRKRTALTLAALTAPWFFLLPTRLFY